MAFEDRVSAYPNRYVLTTEDGSVSYVILERADEPIVPGTPLNAETLNGLVADIDTKLADILGNIGGGASSIVGTNLTASRALVSDSNGKVAVSAVTSTELGYLDGVTSNVQTQLNGKAASSHTHSYLALSGGTLTGQLKTKGIVLTSGTDYGTSLPSAGTAGRLFFKKVT